jgi:hypothetical protein
LEALLDYDDDIVSEQIETLSNYIWENFEDPSFELDEEGAFPSYNYFGAGSYLSSDYEDICVTLIFTANIYFVGIRILFIHCQPCEVQAILRQIDSHARLAIDYSIITRLEDRWVVMPEYVKLEC